MFPYIGAEGKSDLIIVDRMESGYIRVLIEAPRGGGDGGGYYGWDWEDSLGPKVLVRFGGRGLSMDRV